MRTGARPAQEQPPLFSFVGSDSLAQFTGWLLILLPAPVTVPALLHFGGAKAVVLLAAVGLLLLAGLRASIVVTADEAVVTKLWFLVPYRRYRAPAIKDVWYGGDWGEEETASGVVVRLGVRRGEDEIHIGSAKTMHALHDALTPLSERHRFGRVGARGP
jgi:hypothetical protein